MPPQQNLAWFPPHLLWPIPPNLGWRCFPSRFDVFQGTLLPHGVSHPGTELGGVRSTDPFEGAGSPILDVLWVKGNSLEQPDLFFLNLSQSEIALAGELCFVLVLK